MLKSIIKNLYLKIKRFFTPSTLSLLNKHSLHPFSKKFGFDYGTPIDRFYTDIFLSKNQNYITGNICEIAENQYTTKFGHNVSQSTILHVDSSNKRANLIADLTNPSTLPSNVFDCFICTVTLNFIFDYQAALKGIFQTLKGGGAALITVAGLIQISRYDYERWGDFWRFTDMGIKKAAEQIFDEVECETYGNILSAMAELQGIPAEKLTQEELLFSDKNYQILITLVAKKQ